MSKPSVLFVCFHNAGRSQMAAGYLKQLSGGAIDVRSAGNEPADKINPVAVQAMAEEGIDIAAGDSCPYYPGKRYEDWTLDDPAGQGIDVVRAIRNQIRQRVEQLVEELLG
jgi:arsenate reductase